MDSEKEFDASSQRQENASSSEMSVHEYKGQDVEKDDVHSEKFRESDAGDGTKREDHILTGKRYYLCVLSLILAMFLVALDQMITAAVFSTISDQFNSFNKLTWITAAFMTPMGCCAQLWGKLSISFGRKWTLVTGMVLFEIGSLIAGVAQSMNMLICGRAIQGIGGSCVQSCSMIIAVEITTIDKKALLLGVMSLTFVVAGVIGPIIGGVFGSYVTWRWCFYINLCLGGIALPFFIFTYKTVSPKGTFREKITNIDIIGNILMISSCVLILVALSCGVTEKWSSASTIACFVLGGILFIVFCIYNFKYSKHPVIPTRIVNNWRIDAALCSFSVSYSMFLVFEQFLSIYFQNIVGHNPMHTGLSLIPGAISVSGFGIFSGIFIKMTGQVKLLPIFAGIFLAVGSGLIQLLPVKENLGYSIGFQILLGVGCGLNFQSPLMSALVLASKEPGSNILTTALFNFMRSTLSALFSEVGSVIYSEILKKDLPKIIPQLTQKNIDLTRLVTNLDLLNQLNAHDKLLIRTQILHSIRGVFWLCFGLSLVSLLSSWLMSNKRIPKGDKVEA